MFNREQGIHLKWTDIQLVFSILEIIWFKGSFSSSSKSVVYRSRVVYSDEEDQPSVHVSQGRIESVIMSLFVISMIFNNNSYI